MTYNVGLEKSTCMRDPIAECNRMWTSQADGLHLAYFKTRWQETRSTYAADCEDCVRNRPVAAPGA
jgi:hypothetical protein